MHRRREKRKQYVRRKFLAYISENFWVELSGMPPETPQISSDYMLDLNCRHFSFNDHLGSLSNINRTVDRWLNVVIGKG